MRDIRPPAGTDCKLAIWHFDSEKQSYRFFNSKQLLFSSYISNSVSKYGKNARENRRQLMSEKAVNRFCDCQALQEEEEEEERLTHL